MFDVKRSYLQNIRLMFGEYMTPGDTVIKTGAGTIVVRSLTLDNPNVGGTIGPNRDTTYERAKCVLKQLGLPLPATRNGMYWADLSPSVLGYTVYWRGPAGYDWRYSFISRRYMGRSMKANLFEDLLATLYHEFKARNYDGVEDDAAYEYDAGVMAAIAAAKENGEWDKIINRDCVKA